MRSLTDEGISVAVEHVLATPLDELRAQLRAIGYRGNVWSRDRMVEVFVTSWIGLQCGGSGVVPGTQTDRAGIRRPQPAADRTLSVGP